MLYFFISCNLFAGTKDTTVSGNLNNDNILDEVKVSFTTNDGMYSYLEGDFSVDINGIIYKDKCEEAEVFEVKIVDIDPTDMYREVMISCFGYGEVGEYFFYRFKGANEIVKLGNIKLWGSAEAPGNGVVSVHDFMGFWTLNGDYAINPETEKLEMIKKDSYDVNVEGTVKGTFKILKARDDKSDVVETLKSGMKVDLLKCDITPVCKGESGYDDEYECDWYLIRTPNGREGWARLKDFREQISDLPWAG
jgi:hypothetical protein